MVSSEEETLIVERMEKAKIRNLSAYLRKMAIDGYIIQLDLAPLRDLLSLLRHCSTNLNQLTKKVNAHGRFYEADLHQLQMEYEELWTLARTVVTHLAEIP